MFEFDETKRDELLESLLANVPKDSSILVDLPSECRVYPDLETDVPVKIQPITFEDEKVLASSRGEGKDGTSMLLARCVPDVDIQNLLIMDQTYLVLKLREISYGDDYIPTVICPKCGIEHKIVIKLSELTCNPVPDDFKEPIEIVLPQAKNTVIVRLARVKDQKHMDDLHSNLWRFVESVDGHKDRGLISAFLGRLNLLDIKTITKALTPEYGIDPRIKYICKDCKYQAVIALPIDSNFFGVS